MRNLCRIATPLFAACIFVLGSHAAQAQSANAERTAAAALIARILPERAKSFEVEIIPSDKGSDVFEIESRNGKIVLRGNTPVSVASALNWYLKYSCHCQISWGGDNLTLPHRLPVVPAKIRHISPYRQRVYGNYCTFSYTMPWWDWARWQREIDWMALHGVNMPLAITGQEAVWEATLRQYGMSDDEIRRFLCGPAFFAWQWMTNQQGYDGPLPQAWIDRNLALGKQILSRERELGMTPILQGFTGFVPDTLIAKYPNAHIKAKPIWCPLSLAPHKWTRSIRCSRSSARPSCASRRVSSARTTCMLPIPSTKARRPCPATPT